jgi:hypothetical protein
MNDLCLRHMREHTEFTAVTSSTTRYRAGRVSTRPRARATCTVIASPEEFDQAPNDIEMLRRIYMLPG